jgi:hypothetical protein
LRPLQAIGVSGAVGLLVLALLIPFPAAAAAGTEGRILTVPRPRQIVAIPPRGGVEQVLFRAGDGEIGGPAATPDGHHIAFILRHWRRSRDGSVRVFRQRDEVWVMRGDGTGAHPVRSFIRRRRGSRWTYPPSGAPGARGALQSIDISGNGSRLLIARYNALYMLDADGGDLRRVRTPGATPTGYTGSDIDGPQFAPGGRRIVADFVAENEEGIGTVSVHGGPVRFISTRRPGLAASYSDDGRWIVFAAIAPSPRAHPHREGRHTIWIMRADGSGQRQVVDRPGLTFHNPDFSPDGRQLVLGGPCHFHGSRIIGKEQVCAYTVGTDGRDLRRVARGVLRFHAEENPEWVR